MDEEKAVSAKPDVTSPASAGFEAWAREVGYFPFHRALLEEVARFRETFGHDIQLRPEPPDGVQGLSIAFWISLPGWTRGRDYCLYGEIVGTRLAITLGWAEAGGSTVLLRPYRQIAVLDHLQDLTELDFADWFRSLLRMHCDKI